MKTKLLAVVGAALFVLSCALLWLLDSKVQEEKKTSAEVGLRGPVNAVSLALLADLRGLRRGLPSDATLSKEKLDWESFKPFFALAHVQMTAQGPHVLQFANSNVWPTSEWTAKTAEGILAGISARPTSGETLLSIGRYGENRKTIVALFQEGEAFWVGFAGAEFLQGLLDLQKGPKGWLSIVNSSGQVLGHSQIDYVGTSVGAGSALDRALHGSAPRGFQAFDSGAEDSQLAAFEKIEGTDVMVMAARPVAEMRAERGRLLLFGVVASLGILMFALSILWTLLGQFEAQQAKTLEVMRTTIPAKGDALLAPANTAKDREEVLARVAATLGYELRSPLIAILGYAHSILGLTSDKNLTAPVDSIVRETRVAREVIDKLLSFAGESPGLKKPTRLETVLVRVLKEYETKFLQRHIKVHKDLRETTEIPLSPEAIEKVFRHLLNNAMESMERLPKKELWVRMSEDLGGVQIEVQDKGEGIDPSEQQKIFDPFFTTRNRAHHLGMGLPASVGLLRDHQATLKLESAPGKGTTVVLNFPKTQKTVEIAGQTVALTTEAIVEVPKAIPTPQSSPELPPMVAIDPAVETSAAAVAASPGPSPTDVDIDHLLALPEQGSFSAAIPVAASSPVSAEPLATVAVEKLLSELPPIDDEKTPSVAMDAAPLMVPDSTESVAAKPVVDDEKTPVVAPTPEAQGFVRKVTGGVDLPAFALPRKPSKLDSFRAVIRRPTARPT